VPPERENIVHGVGHCLGKQRRLRGPRKRAWPPLRLCGCGAPGWPSTAAKSTPLMRVCAGERNEPGVSFGDVASAQVELLFREHGDAAAFGRFRRRATRVARRRRDVRWRCRRGKDSVAWRLPERDGCPVLSGATRPRRRRLPPRDRSWRGTLCVQQAIHARDADGAQPIRQWWWENQTRQQRDRTTRAWETHRRGVKGRNGFKVTQTSRKIRVSAGKQDV